MAEIRINTEDIQSKGVQFATKSQEVQALINQGKQMMAALEGTFTGVRANAIQAEWAGYQAGLAQAVATLQQTGDLLKRAAADFGSADSGM